jgi:nitronate monooxygenase
VVSFHSGLPDSARLARVKAAGCRIMASATTVAHALWLEARGVDIVIAQGYEAGGHRGMLLAPNLKRASAFNYFLDLTCRLRNSATLCRFPQLAVLHH